MLLVFTHSFQSPQVKVQTENIKRSAFLQQEEQQMLLLVLFELSSVPQCLTSVF